MFVHKSLDTIKISSITTNVTSDNLFLKTALDLSFKPSSFVPGSVPRPEKMVVPPIFTVDVPVGQSKRTLVFFRVLPMIKQCF